MDEVQYEVKDGVAVITLFAPKRRNALTPAMAADLVAAVDRADARDDVGSIVLCGGRSFCAGADLQTLGGAGSDPSDDVSYQTIDTLYAAFQRVGAAEVPVIAAVRGAAVGAGFNLAMAADLRVCARDARLLSGFGRIGVHPGGGHFMLLARLAGREVAAAMGLFGDEVDGSQAVDLGLAWCAVDDAEVDTVAFNFARRAAADPALTRKMVASLRLETGPGLSWEAAVQLERAPQMWSLRRRTA